MLSLAFYTCFMGSDNNKACIIPPLPSKNYDCYYFTNNFNIIDKLAGTGWRPIYCDEVTTDDVFDSNLKAKKYKVLPHNIPELNKYKYTCYLDTKVNKKIIWGNHIDVGVINEEAIENSILLNMDDFNKCYLLLIHPNIGANLFDEFFDSMQQERYRIQRSQILSYINYQINRNRLTTTESPHYTNKFIIRNMHDPITRKIDETWYEHIKLCGIQDQISFFFVKQFFSTKIGLLHEKDVFIKN